MKFKVLGLLVALNGCSVIPDHIEPAEHVPSANLKVKHSFNAPMLGYSTHVTVHTEQDTCDEHFLSKSATNLVVLDIGNPLVSEMNEDGVRLAVGKKYSFWIMSLSGMSTCTLFTSFEPKANEYYEMIVSGKLGGHNTSCNASLFSYDEQTKSPIPIEFDYHGDCKQPSE